MKKEWQWLLKEKYKGKAGKGFIEDVKRLEKGEPLDYVIGFSEFLGCKIDLSKKPLIPRPETEFWVEKAIDVIKKSNQKRINQKGFKTIKVLDIFSGSGCIGVSVLKNIKEAKADFLEKDKEGIRQIKINLKLNKISPKRYRVIESDIFKKLKEKSGFINTKYDFIFANPPYIAQHKKNKIQDSVLRYEPKKALFGGKDGFFYIERFLKQAKEYLNKEGIIFMEFDYIQKNRIESLVKKNQYKEYKSHKDQYGRWRWIMIK